MNYRFKFFNFKPSSALIALSGAVLEEILDRAPSDAVPIARLIRRDDGFEATLELYSKEGAFVGRALERTPERALSNVRIRIEERIIRWKLNRFAGAEIIRSIDNNDSNKGGPHGTQVH